MQLGIFAKTFPSENPLQALDSVQKAGFVCTQYNMSCSGMSAMPEAINTQTANAVLRASEETNIPIVAVSATFNMIHPDINEREDGLKRLEVIAANAKAMGTELLTLCTGTRNPDDKWQNHAENDTLRAWGALLQSMERAIKIAETHDVKLAIEPELANVVNSAAKAERLIRQLQSDRLKVVLDPANLFEQISSEAQNRLISEAVECVADHLVMAHAKDRLPDGEFTTAGKGVLNYRHYLQALSDCGFDGPLITHGLAAQDAPKAAKFLRKMLKQIR